LEPPIAPQLNCLALDMQRKFFQAAGMKKSIRNGNPQPYDGDEYS
jgi:hypothetical protein